MFDPKETTACIRQILIPYAACFAWKDFNDSGTPCYHPFRYDSPQEATEAAFTRASVYLAMPKGSQTHRLLGQRVASVLGRRWVQYDWLVKIVGRILSGSTPDELSHMVTLASRVQEGMKKRGLTQITSIEEALY